MRYPNDDEIQDHVSSFQQGEERGFTYIFNKLYNHLLYYAFRFLKDKARAEDIVAESFFKIWERHSQFSNYKVIKSWLYTTVRNACLNELEASKKRIARQEDISRMQDTVSEPNVFHETIRAEFQELESMIRSLSDRQQEVIHLLFIEKKSNQEAADELNISVNTVKNHRAKALELLRVKLTRRLAY